MFWERFYELCINRGTKPNPVAQEIGIASGTLSKWKDGKTFPNGETLIKISKYFNCSVDYLLGISSSKSEFSKEDLEFLSKFQSLDAENKEEVMMFINLKLQLQEKRKGKSSNSILKNTYDEVAL